MTQNKKQAYTPRISVVINTCDRGAYLGDTLEGLKQQTYDSFEVIVVNGPSQDNTEEVAKNYNVRYYTAPYNISVSRNIGIKHSTGEIVAFIDDDAVPEPNWLKDLAEAYKDNSVGAAGGLVYNHDGSAFQFCYGMIDKWGYPELRQDKPYDYNEPKGDFYNINIGTNASYRRDVLLEIGGFDEEIEYYHDESDVCVRVINAGYKVAQLSNAYVHHKMAPSSRRDTKKKVTNWDAIVKNSIYFGVKHTDGISPLYKRLFVPGLREIRKFVVMLRDLFKGQYTPWQYVVRNISLVRAFFRGYTRGFSTERKYIVLGDEKNEYKQYKQNLAFQPKNFVLVTQSYPPYNTDGISRYNSTLAQELAERGERVFIVTKSPDTTPRIEFRDKHWVYSHVPARHLSPATQFGRTDELLALTKSVYETVKGITKKNKIDLILAPLWDIEGLALVEKKLAPTVITLMSPLKKVVETQWFWLDDPSLETVYELERYVINKADGVMAISQAIMDTMAEKYGIDWKAMKGKKNVEVLPLGVDNKFTLRNVPISTSKDTVNILFVGRFERRKGIDILLNILPELLAKNQKLTISLVGNATGTDENGRNVYKDFIKKYKAAEWFSRIKQYGYVSDEELADLYAKTDIFVAPSRYESFGIIFIEAMAFGKPVVGTNIGGIPEIIHHKENGLLFELEDEKGLYGALEDLVRDYKKRAKYGKRSKELLQEKFSAKLMGDRFLVMTDKVMKR